MRRLLREPLLHFLAGGALLFALYGIVVEDPSYAPDRIVVDEAKVANLAESFGRVWMRPPAPDELERLIDEYVNEEVMVREALALGFDRDDSVIRRRLRQKMEFLNEDLVDIQPPTDADLNTYLSENREQFRRPARVSFRQVYVDPEAGTGSPRERANAILAALKGGDDKAEGDQTLLPPAMESATESDVANVFGVEFAADVLARSSDGWSDPIGSSFGLHLVNVDARTPARDPELDEVRPQVVREWESIARADANRESIRKLREQYEVEVRRATAEPDGQSLSRVE